MKLNFKKIISIVLIVLIFFQMLIVSSPAFATIKSSAQDYYVDYSGSTNAGWGYKPYCTLF